MFGGVLHKLAIGFIELNFIMFFIKLLEHSEKMSSHI